MAKGRRSDRLGAPPPVTPPPLAGGSREDLARRIDALRDDVASARADAEARRAGLPPVVRPEPARQAPPLRPPYPRSPAPANRRRALLLLAALVGLAVMALLAGLLATPSRSPGARRRRAAPATAVAPPGSIVAPPGAPARDGPSASSAPAPGPPTGAAPVTATVQAGQSFWSIATAVVAARVGTIPTAEQIGPYWVALVAANAADLRQPDDPDLIYPGQTVVVPSA